MSHIKTLTLVTALSVSALGLSVATPANAESMQGKQSSQWTTPQDPDVALDMNFATVDKNADGKITEQEFSSSVDAETSTETFAELDQNDDGSLNKAEFDIAAAAHTGTKAHK